MESVLTRPINTAERIQELVQELQGPRLSELMLCISHSWGGLEQVTAQDAIERSGLGLKVKVLVLEGTPIHEALSKKKEVEVVALDYRPRDFLDFKLRSELQNQVDAGVNLVHTHQTTLLGSISPWLFRKRQVSLFASRHILNNHDKRDFVHRLIYSRLDALVVMSEALRRNVLETHPLRERQVKVINLGLDFERFDCERVDRKRQRAEWGVDDDQTAVIGLVGRIDPAKGQGTFIKAAAGLLRAVDGKRKLKFVIVGEETLGRSAEYLTELREMVRQFQIEEHVLFAGYQENIPEVMSALDIFTMPSRQEAFGLVAIEAMAMECPIVISSGGSSSEIIGEAQSGGLAEFGVLVRPDDAFDLQQQLRLLIEDAQLTEQMGKAARKHVMKHYDRHLRIWKTLELYDHSRKLRERMW